MIPPLRWNLPGVTYPDAPSRKPKPARNPTAPRLNAAAYWRDYYRRRVEHARTTKTCVVCRAPHETGLLKCAPCHEKNSKAVRAIYAFARVNRKCIACGGTSEPGRQRCAPCAKIRAEDQARLRAENAPKRLRQARDAHRRLTKRRKAAGLCVPCGAPSEKYRCPACNAHRTELQRLRRAAK